MYRHQNLLPIILLHVGHEDPCLETNQRCRQCNYRIDQTCDICWGPSRSIRAQLWLVRQDYVSVHLQLGLGPAAPATSSIFLKICTSIQRAHDSAAYINSVHPKVVCHQVWCRSEGVKLTVYHEFWFGTVDPHEKGQKFWPASGSLTGQNLSTTWRAAAASTSLHPPWSTVATDGSVCPIGGAVLE